MNFIGYRTIKTALGSAIAMIIAAALGLKYGTAAGVIVILSVQSTKRQSVKIALQRMGACLLALFISSVLFNIFGYSAYVFGIFILAFIPLAAKFRLNDGIVVSSVLVTHLLVEKTTSVSLLINELLLMLIGVVVALLLNMYMPSIEKDIKNDISRIEDIIRELLLHMSMALKECAISIKEEELFNELELKLNKGLQRAYRILNNSLFVDNSYYAKYMDMRLQQLSALKNMRRHFERFSITYKQTEMIAEFTLRLSNSIHEYNSAEGLLKSLQELRESFTEMELPKTREEFENRAMLYQFLNDLEQFLIIKRDFKMHLKDNNIVDLY
ncbi:hypothetical protein HMPREF1982_03167 [Clostridiales bacterium oral taxon 876 str. F0540]|nr:hypothetical protein HMPREF1982_03167 [Clostridiales bacterium oral taxon 876 str. F0540]